MPLGALKAWPLASRWFHTARQPVLFLNPGAATEPPLSRSDASRADVRSSGDEPIWDYRDSTVKMNF